ncbi:MAG TPA: DUF192 domain-containing protein [Candidatus Udaeobacter sp.]|nr:DUF192 domain-containing protein [Candidatus Udaeobacter sp.]
MLVKPKAAKRPGGAGVDCREGARYCFAMRILILWMGVLLAIATGAAASQAEDLDIVTSQGPQHFSVELATTEAERELGLMYRQNLAADAGMLFIYPGEQEVAFWMKNTLIPLDMLFIGADGRIRRIEERAIPLNETPISSIYPVKAVLEVNGGTVERLGIHAGDLVRNAALGTGG